MEETRGGMDKLLRPQDSVSFSGNPRHVWAEDGRWEIVTEQEKNALNGRN